MRPAIVFAAAPLAPTDRLRSRLAELADPVVIAADNGATTALAFGLTPDVVVGDFDSIDAATQAELDRRKVPVEAFPRDKDQTDGQLAVERALRAQPEEAYLLGFLGGARLDMTLANVLLLTRYGTRMVLLDERNECVLLAAPASYAWRPEDETLSLLPLNGDAVVTTRGLRWPLRNETLYLGDTRGLSNEPVSTAARVEIASGSVLLTRHFAQV